MTATASPQLRAGPRQLYTSYIGNTSYHNNCRYFNNTGYISDSRPAAGLPQLQCATAPLHQLWLGVDASTQPFCNSATAAAATPAGPPLHQLHLPRSGRQPRQLHQMQQQPPAAQLLYT